MSGLDLGAALRAIQTADCELVAYCESGRGDHRERAHLALAQAQAHLEREAENPMTNARFYKNHHGESCVVREALAS